MAEVRMSLDAFEDILEKIPGKTLTAKVRYVLQFYDEIAGGEEISILSTDSEGIQEVKKARYSERLDSMYIKMCDDFYRKIGISLDEAKELGIIK